jgi:hypothetical protein
MTFYGISRVKQQLGDNCYPTYDINWNIVNHRGYITFIHDNEGSHMWQIIDYLHQEIEKRSIPENKVIFMNCNYNIKKNYDKWLNGGYKDNHNLLSNLPSKKWKPFNVLHYDSIHEQVQYDIHSICKDTSFENLYTRNSYLPIGEDVRLFLNLNRLPHSWRLNVIKLLKRKKLLDNSYWSCLGIQKPKTLGVPYDYVDCWKPNYDIPGNNKNLSYYHYNTYFSLVNESEVDRDILFLTEKILKPIYYGQPFIVIANPHFLKYLKELGYETYSEIFDESYDEILDLNKRIDKVVSEIDRLSKLSKKQLDDLFSTVIEKVKYNQHNFITNKVCAESLRKKLSKVVI